MVAISVGLKNTSATLKGLQQSHLPEFPEETKEMPGTWVVKGLVLAALTYIGMNVAPMMVLMSMLETATDDDTCREAVTALAMLANYEPAVEAMHKLGGRLLVNELSETTTDGTSQHSCALLEKLDHWKIHKS